LRVKTAAETDTDDAAFRHDSPTKKPGMAGLLQGVVPGIQLPTFT
jgi:hypothetical protein